MNAGISERAFEDAIEKALLHGGPDEIACGQGARPSRAGRLVDGLRRGFCA